MCRIRPANQFAVNMRNGGCSSVVEPRIVVPVVVGSIPIAHPARALFRQEITPAIFISKPLNLRHLTRTPLQALPPNSGSFQPRPTPFLQHQALLSTPHFVTHFGLYQRESNVLVVFDYQ